MWPFTLVLIQIQKQHKLIAPGAAVLDLGCAPGAWLQVACQNLGPLEKGGLVVGVDVKVRQSADCVIDGRGVGSDFGARLLQNRSLSISHHIWCITDGKTHTYKVEQYLPENEASERGFSVILSDMCPVVSGITTRDEAISCELGMRALSLAVGKIKVKESADYRETMERFQTSTGPDPDEDGVLRRGGSLVIKFLENEDIPGFNKFCKEKFKKVSLLRPKATRSSSREIYMICEGLR
uniref:rRNA methyltransferase 2, mitochondrial n=1 Tax=Aegilops tauschii TaxID=37682 RepID=N1QVU4_AEGTA